MHPPTPLEASLDAVLIGELWSHHHHDVDDTFVDIILDDLEVDDTDDGGGYYAAFEMVIEVVIEEVAATTEFVRVRDTSHDHVVTVRFPRAALEVETAEVPRYSAPYERIEVAEGSVSYANALPFPLYSVPFERVELGTLPAVVPAWLDESTEVLVPSSPRVVRALVAIVAIGGALALGLGLMRLALP